LGGPRTSTWSNLRLATAERLLIESDLPITRIADLSGFSSQSHLTSAMRRHRNVTPMQIRASR
jgi:AraC family transcriptional regulator